MIVAVDNKSNLKGKINEKLMFYMTIGLFSLTTWILQYLQNWKNHLSKPFLHTLCLPHSVKGTRQPSNFGSYWSQRFSRDEEVDETENQWRHWQFGLTLSCLTNALTKNQWRHWKFGLPLSYLMVTVTPLAVWTYLKLSNGWMTKKSMTSLAVWAYLELSDKCIN
jgi:hypothetical protein